MTGMNNKVLSNGPLSSIQIVPTPFPAPNQYILLDPTWTLLPPFSRYSRTEANLLTVGYEIPKLLLASAHFSGQKSYLSILPFLPNCFSKPAWAWSTCAFKHGAIPPDSEAWPASFYHYSRASSRSRMWTPLQGPPGAGRRKTFSP